MKARLRRLGSFTRLFALLNGVRIVMHFKTLWGPPAVWGLWFAIAIRGCRKFSLSRMGNHCNIELMPLPQFILKILCFEIASCLRKVDPFQTYKILQLSLILEVFFSLFLLDKGTNLTRTKTSFSNFVCDLTSWAHSHVYFLPSQNANIWGSCHWKPLADDNREQADLRPTMPFNVHWKSFKSFKNSSKRLREPVSWVTQPPWQTIYEARACTPVLLSEGEISFDAKYGREDLMRVKRGIRLH